MSFVVVVVRYKNNIRRRKVGLKISRIACQNLLHLNFKFGESFASHEECS